jgi:hypothetical protein
MALIVRSPPDASAPRRRQDWPPANRPESINRER